MARTRTDGERGWLRLGLAAALGLIAGATLFPKKAEGVSQQKAEGDSRRKAEGVSRRTAKGAGRRARPPARPG